MNHDHFASDCLDESTVWSFLHEALPAPEVAKIRQHLGVCEPCRGLVAEVVKSLGPVRRSEPTIRDVGAAVSIVAKAKVDDRATDPRSRSVDTVREGEIIDGKYRVERVLGRGGMGYVVLATHLKLGTRVAIKFLFANLLDRADAVPRFMREARAAAQIHSDHVVKVFDVAAAPEGEPYLVMEYLEGKDLAHELRARGSLDVETAVGYALEAAEGLARAHAAGIIHRDLKPANMFLATDSNGVTRLKLLDFGTSKFLRSSGSEFSTVEAMYIGTPRYMAPEQLTLGRPVDQRTDIWAMGCILFEMLAGKPPFAGKSVEAVAKSILDDEPSLVFAARRDVPSELKACIARALAKSPDHRYASAAELASAIAPFASSQTPVARSETPVAHPGSSIRPFGPPPRSRAAKIGIGAAAVAASISLGYGLSRALGDDAGAAPLGAAAVMPSSSAVLAEAPSTASAAPEVVPANGVEPSPSSDRSSSPTSPRQAGPPAGKPRPRNPTFGTRR
jgi:serine/threonine protein kinase